MNAYIDLGAYRGLYVNRFVRSSMYTPDTKIYAFECNPHLRGIKYGDNVITIHKAAWIFDGFVNFYLSKKSPALVQGSSICKEKKTGNLDTAHPYLLPCIDFSQWIKNTFQLQDNIILKMNIEGAEYDILEKMIADDTIKYIKSAWIQWHWERCRMPKGRHDNLLTKLRGLINLHNGYKDFK